MGLGAIGLIGSVASTGLQIYGQMQQAEASQQAAEYNNQLALAEARNREAETTESITRQRRNNTSALASLRTRLATSGVQAGTGTALDIMGAAAGRMEIDIADAARASAMQAASLRAKGKMGLWEADQMQSASRLGMASTALTGLTSAFGMYREGAYQGVNYRLP